MHPRPIQILELNFKVFLPYMRDHCSQNANICCSHAGTFARCWFHKDKRRGKEKETIGRKKVEEEEKKEKEEEEKEDGKKQEQPCFILSSGF